MSCSILLQQLKREVNKILMNRIISAGKWTENQTGDKFLFAICPIKIKSSRAVLFPIEKAKSCCESVITGARKTSKDCAGRCVKRPNGPENKTTSVYTNYFLKLLELLQ